MKGTDKPTCAAKTRKEGNPPCARVAGWGTNHLGYGRCKYHGGSTPTGIIGAQRQAAAVAVATYGLPREVDPHSALLEELHRTAGHVAWLAELVAALERRDLKQYQHMEAGGTVERPAIWVELYHRERRHFAEVAKTCVSVGIEERRVQLAEEQGHLIARVLDGVLRDLGVRDRPEVPDVVRRHLTLVAG